MQNVLLYGFGNPGRQDDGLGIKLTEKIENWAGSQSLLKIQVDTNYQLNIEDAETISNYDCVIFADASQEEIESFEYTDIDPSEARVEFTMHAVSPAYILYLCNHLFHKNPRASLLHIKGYLWDFKEGLSGQAAKNLERAFSFLKNKLVEELALQTEYNKTL